MKHLLAFFFIAISFFTFGQNQGFWVTFANKAETTFELNQPNQFLSQQILDRRTAYNLPIDSTDLPVCASYITAVEDLGFELRYASKWLNGILVLGSTVDSLPALLKLPYVTGVIELGFIKNINSNNKLQVHTELLYELLPANDYGFGANQIEMIAGERLHQMGFEGNGVDVAVMDNGFLNVPNNPFFENAVNLGRINQGYNLVKDTSFVYAGGEHGSYVLSTMASDNDNFLVGTAPKANYTLFVTEDDKREGLPEEIYWAVAAEMAEATLGRQVILTTSLGYSNGFDISAHNHTYAEMDGNTTIITRAANFAANKGLLVVNSAGNEGNSNWRYITAPGDGDLVLTVGAVGPNRQIVAFSSRGPAFDGDLKPNVSAQGAGVTGVDTAYQLVAINGTSFSCPIISGAAASLWEAFPEKSNMQIKTAIEKSAHLYFNPNNDYGYGIPNFYAAYQMLAGDIDIDADLDYAIFPNPAAHELTVLLFESTEVIEYVAIYDLNGQIVRQIKEVDSGFLYIDIADLPKGTYAARVKKGDTFFEEKFIKL